MKKFLGIIVLGLLFVSIDLSNPTKVVADMGKPLPSIYGKKGWFEKKLDDLNPITYFEKRKKCKQVADDQDTVAIGKLRYKECMNDYQ